MVGFGVSSCYPTSFHHICFFICGEQITCSGDGNCIGLLLAILFVNLDKHCNLICLKKQFMSVLWKNMLIGALTLTTAQCSFFSFFKCEMETFRFWQQIASYLEILT